MTTWPSSSGGSSSPPDFTAHALSRPPRKKPEPFSQPGRQPERDQQKLRNTSGLNGLRRSGYKPLHKVTPVNWAMDPISAATDAAGAAAALPALVMTAASVSRRGLGASQVYVARCRETEQAQWRGGERLPGGDGQPGRPR